MSFTVQFQVLKCCMCQDCSRLLWLIISCLGPQVRNHLWVQFVHGPVSGSRFEPYRCEGNRAADTSDAGQQPLSLGCLWPAGKMIIAMAMVLLYAATRETYWSWYIIVVMKIIKTVMWWKYSISSFTVSEIGAIDHITVVGWHWWWWQYHIENVYY